MARRSGPLDKSEGLRKKLLGLLNEFDVHLRKGDLRMRVKALIPAFNTLRDLGASLIPRTDASNARARIISYLRSYPFLVIDGNELMVVSGIQEWARRLRELRVQFGWWIYSGVTLKQISLEDREQAASIKNEYGIEASMVKPDQYVLMRREQDKEAALRWNQINEIRREKLGVRDKILKFLILNVGSTVHGEELAYLAGGKKEWARRVRELRTEFGWAISTRQSGRSDLPIGAYLLEHDRQAVPHDRKIPDVVRVEVLERDRFRCVNCGWELKDASASDPRKYLELHHIEHHGKGGKNIAKNLVTLCNVHHDAVHAGKLEVK